MKIFGGLFGGVGTVFTGGGALLLSLGGSSYYLLSGLAMLLAAALVWHGRSAGFWICLGNFVATLAWAVLEAGFDFWLLLPRISVPTVLMLCVVLGMAGRSRQSNSVRIRSVMAWATLVVALPGIIFAIGFLDKEKMLPILLHISSGVTNLNDDTSEWRNWGRTAAGTRYVPAEQITSENVHRLKVAWTYRTGDLPSAYPDERRGYSFEATPLKVADTLYFCTPHNQIVALNAATGREQWRFDPKIDPAGVFLLTCRGVAYHEANANMEDCKQRIIFGTLDARLMAVDANTGKRCRNFGNAGEVSLRDGMGQVKPGYHLVTSPPTIVGNVAIVGGFVLDNMSTYEPPGVVRGFDVLTGRLLWAWDSGRPEEAGPWRQGDEYTQGSPNAWTVFSADEALGLVYIPTGNPTPDHYGGLRTVAQERFSSSVVALDAQSGELRWAFQTVRHDLWDYDVASQPVLVDLPINGEVVPALIQPTKQGDIFLLDRRNGQPLLPVYEQPAPRGNVSGEWYAASQPTQRGALSFTPPLLREEDMWGATSFDQLWCRIQFRRLRYEGRFTPPGLDASLLWPGSNGVINWGSVAVDEARRLMVVNSSYMPLILQLLPRSVAPQGEQIVLDGGGAISPQSGTPYAVRTERPLMSPFGVPCNAPPWGRLSVIDLEQKQIVWQRPLGTTYDHAPFGISVPGVFNQGGGIVTKSGLIFIGSTLDNYLRAFDLLSGKELWKARLPAGAQATPMSFFDEKSSKQYVVIAAGGHQYMRTTIGDYVIAFALSE